MKGPSRRARRRAPADSSRLLFESNPQPMFIVDRKTLGFMDCNQAARAKYGWSRAEFQRMSLADIRPAEDVPRLQAYMKKPARGLEYAGEWRHRLKDGRVIDVEIMRQAVRFRGRPALLSVAVDVTGRRRIERERERVLAREKAARAQAEELSRLKDEFLAVISHELRTPLTAMLGWLKLLREGAISPDEREKALDVIERNMRASAQIIEDMLDISSIVTGKLRLELGRMEISPVLLAAADSMRPEANAKGVRVELSVCDGPVPVLGDPSRLQQVLWNLLSNAVKFTGSGGVVRVSLRRNGSDAEVGVSDTGKGISPEFLPHVFDRFRQEENSMTRSHRGLGLGLAIVRHIVDLHGGGVRAESAGPGRGACFTVTLPLIGAGESR